MGRTITATITRVLRAAWNGGAAFQSWKRWSRGTTLDGIRPATLGAWETGSMLLRYWRASFVGVWNACGTLDRG